MAEKGSNPKDSPSEKDVKSPNILERVKDEIEAVFHHDKSPRHHKETHGRSDDIDEKTDIDDVKAPGVFERVKEEFEAVVEAIHPKKEDSGSHESTSK
ncbi:putative plant/F1L3-4 protein [Senna tora]|uniref:Putative plant/F1L3-4 protein n=1 Tax=Senna tora TaxID=362788 RepID=A0A834WA67_9FABA|nr:putative plant/F1L3-4 protein [Senna tora]